MNFNLHDERLDRLVEAVQQTNLLLEGMKITLTQISERSIDHEDRLRVLEKWRHNLTPILAALTFLSGAVFSEMVQRMLFH
ncbi:MAG: hypothetical protein HUJ26_08170 [Planctomycetaceae bacterium]|nr:hypothetical protein [Planctomycetaceae bacterium]